VDEVERRGHSKRFIRAWRSHQLHKLAHHAADCATEVPPGRSATHLALRIGRPKRLQRLLSVLQHLRRDARAVGKHNRHGGTCTGVRARRSRRTRRRPCERAASATRTRPGRAYSWCPRGLRQRMWRHTHKAIPGRRPHESWCWREQGGRRTSGCSVSARSGARLRGRQGGGGGSFRSFYHVHQNGDLIVAHLQLSAQLLEIFAGRLQRHESSKSEERVGQHHSLSGKWHDIRS